MAQKRGIKNAKKRSDRAISYVLLQGNQRYTKKEKVIKMVEKGTLELDGYHVVYPKKGAPYLRANPDRKLSNNLQNMADS